MSPPPIAADSIYLDHAAATPVRPEVAEAMAEAMAEGFANPSSPHRAGRLAKRLLEESRERILAAAGSRSMAANRDRLVFTSGATEANRMAVLGLAGERAGTAATSARDHPGLRLAAGELSRQGWRLAEIPLTQRGCLETSAVGPLFAELSGPRLMTVTTVCGQTGLMEDDAAIGRLAEVDPGLLIHADATQAAGWQLLRFSESPFTTLALAPHKFGGPRGIGGVIIRGTTAISPLIPGPQELGLRGGTEAVALAVGFARAFELAVLDQAVEAERVATLRSQFEAGLLAAATSAGLTAQVIGATAVRAPHVSALAILGVDRQMFVLAADLAGVCLSTGTACSSGSGEPPAVLVALGVDPEARNAVVRASFGRTTTPDDVAAAVERLTVVLSRMRR